MTPFEKSADFAFALSSGLYECYAFQNYVPVIENLERQSKDALLAGDVILCAQIAQVYVALNRELSEFSFDA